jgi:hypothetical protein
MMPERSAQESLRIYDSGILLYLDVFLSLAGHGTNLQRVCRLMSCASELALK